MGTGNSLQDIVVAKEPCWSPRARSCQARAVPILRAAGALTWRECPTRRAGGIALAPGAKSPDLWIRTPRSPVACHSEGGARVIFARAG